MRVRGEDAGLTVQVIAGTQVVLLGFDASKPLRRELLGFAVERTDLTTNTTEWLPNFLRFAANDRPDGPTSSRENPLQAFQWGDYGVLPGQSLSYRILALRGAPGALERAAEVTVEVDTELADDGRHAIYFNRGVAGSQAYERKFGSGSPLTNPEARKWLSRGLEEGLLEFIGRAVGAGWSLRGAFYEFSHPPVLEALYAAQARGVDLKLVVEARTESDGSPMDSTRHNTEAIREVPAHKRRGQPAFTKFIVPRKGTKGIPHNKFLVLLSEDRPVAVWTGSTNITSGGIYGQSNVGHAVADGAVADQYLAYWAQLAGDPAIAALRPWVGEHSPVPTRTKLADAPEAGETASVFSPRDGLEPLERYRELMAGAKQSVFMTAPFGVATEFEQVLAENTDIPRYVLLDKRDKFNPEKGGIDFGRSDPDNHVAVGAYLGRGGYRQFLEEHLTGLNSWVEFIHTKYLLIDPLTDHPVVVTGSANFSEASTENNDENMLLVSKDERVADIYLTEFMRLFNHFQFRYAVKAKPGERAPDPREPDIAAPRHLDETEEWASDFYEPASPKERERLLFSGQLPG